jgi:hypothetical protein
MKVDVKVLKPEIRAVLKELGWRKRQIQVTLRDSYSVFCPGDDGCRGVFAMTGPTSLSVQRGAFGGAALGAREQHPIDSDQTIRKLPIGCVAVNGQEGSNPWLALTAREMSDIVK